MVAAGVAAILLAAAAAFVLLTPTGGQTPPTTLLVASAAASEPAAAQPATIVVDVEGAVGQPGIRELPAGSRVADAIDAAGGFATDADLDAAMALNLAEALVDGQQVRVPRIGDGAVAAIPPEDGGAGETGGLVNVNTATPEELEALPGIGAVTVQKIVAARQEQPFTTLQEMVDRGVINRGQLEDITDLATAG
jgi:competence protein ComEA